MLLKALFWLFVAVDAAGIGLLFVLGLAAAGPSKTSPLAVAFTLLAVPGALLAGAVLLYLRAPAPGLRLLAFVVVSAPFTVLAVGRVLAEFTARANPGGIHGETPLTRALRELPQQPERIETVRTLLANGADPNEAGEALPVALAILAVRDAGPEALQLLLARGADLNRRDEFGQPVWFFATFGSVDVAVLRTVLDAGADVRATGRDGRGGVWGAVNCQNWPAARLLLERGATIEGRSPMGYALLDEMESQQRNHPRDTAIAEVLAAVRARK